MNLIISLMKPCDCFMSRLHHGYYVYEAIQLREAELTLYNTDKTLVKSMETAQKDLTLEFDRPK